jgi:hypothetical protein
LEGLKKFLLNIRYACILRASAQTLAFFVGNCSSSNMPLHHQPNPQQGQIFSIQENIVLKTFDLVEDLVDDGETC